MHSTPKSLRTDFLKKPILEHKMATGVKISVACVTNNNMLPSQRQMLPSEYPQTNGPQDKCSSRDMLQSQLTPRQMLLRHMLPGKCFQANASQTDASHTSAPWSDASKTNAPRKMLKDQCSLVRFQHNSPR